MKRVLVINHPEADFGGAFIFNGLCQVLGAENVYDFPVKKSYHGENHFYSTPDIANGQTNPFSWYPSYPYPQTNPNDHDACEAEVRERLLNGWFDFVVIESPRKLSIQYARDIRSSVQAARIPTILHDGEDYSQIDVKQARSLNVKLYLKRELLRSEYPNAVFDTQDMRIASFPFSFPDNAIGVPNKPRQQGIARDVAMIMGATWPSRQELANALRGITNQLVTKYIAISPDSDRNVENLTLLPWPDYMGMMSESRCAVSMRGFGMDTCHYWETASMTCMFCDDIANMIHMENALQEGQHCLLYQNPEHCATLVEYFCRKEQHKLGDIFEQGREHVLKHHTNRARVMRMLELLEDL